MLLRWSRYRNRDDSSLSILPSHSSYSRDSGLGVKTGASQAPAPGSIPGYRTIHLSRVLHNAIRLGADSTHHIPMLHSLVIHLNLTIVNS